MSAEENSISSEQVNSKKALKAEAWVVIVSPSSPHVGQLSGPP